MTPAEFKACRLACGLTQSEWAVALGYSLAEPRQQIHGMEAGTRSIMPWFGRLAEMYRRYGVPAEFITPGVSAAAELSRK
jgi:transcriptional regulator with XRE-family HTH domain